MTRLLTAQDACQIDHPGSCAPCACRNESLPSGTIGAPRYVDCRDRRSRLLAALVLALVVVGVVWRLG